nr:autotransporter domain-containing protein [Pantoea sp.]
MERRVTLGPATRTEQGNTGGKLLGLRVQTGWDIPLGSYVTTGPMVSYALDYGHVGGYREQGDSSTAMRFYQQDNHSQIGSVGWRIDTRRWPVNPWAQVSYNHQFGDSDLPVTAGLNSTRTAFSRTVAGPDKNWLDVAVGANVPLGQSISAFAAASTVGGASDYHEVTWNVGINATF